MSRRVKYDWDKLLKEYIKSNLNKTDFAKEKGINPSLFRREASKWPNKSNTKKKSNSKNKSNFKSCINKSNNATNQLFKFEFENPEKLNERELLFCIFYIRNYNGAMAVIKAGFNPGNAQRAAEMAYQILHREPVKKEIQRIKELKRQSIMITEDDIVERHMKIAFADMTDFVTFGKKQVPLVDRLGVVKDSDGEIVTIEANYVTFNESDQIDGGLICEVKQGRQGSSLKLEDRQKSLKFLEEFFNMNPMNKHRQKYDEERLKLQHEELELKKEIEKSKNW